MLLKWIIAKLYSQKHLIMKKATFLIVLVCIVSGAFGQAAPSGNCFKEWYSLFKDRGANPVPDGTNDIIISIRNGDYSDCFMGKVDIKAGSLAGNLMIQKADGTWATFDKKASAAFQGADNRLKPEDRVITDGMSTLVELQDGSLIRLFFYKSLKSKSIGYKRAPSPSQLVK